MNCLVCLTAGSLLSCHDREKTMQKHYPHDLKVSGTAGSLLPGKENHLVEISSDGNGRFNRFLPDTPGPPLEQVNFTVNDSQLEALWEAIKHSDFFSLKPRYVNREISDGAFASLTVTARGRTHQVELENTTVPGFEDLLRVINRITPLGKDLSYKSGIPNK